MVGTARTAAAVATASRAWIHPRHSVRAICTTASATTATAATSSPAIAPAGRPTPPATSRPAAMRTTAVGAVNPSQARSEPGTPARSRPMPIPTCELAGPGRNWPSATRSAYCVSSSHRRRATSSVRKYPRCATGPPKEVMPSRRNVLPTGCPCSPTGHILTHP